MIRRLTLALVAILWANLTLAQGYINPPIYALGIINVAGGSTVTTNINNTRNPPTSLNVFAQGAITTWHVVLPNPTYDGQIITLGCPGGSVTTLNVTAASTIGSGGMTSCTGGNAANSAYQWSYAANEWVVLQNTTSGG